MKAHWRKLTKITFSWVGCLRLLCQLGICGKCNLPSVQEACTAWGLRQCQHCLLVCISCSVSWSPEDDPQSLLRPLIEHLSCALFCSLERCLNVCCLALAASARPVWADVLVSRSFPFLAFPRAAEGSGFWPRTRKRFHAFYWAFCVVRNSKQF